MQPSNALPTQQVNETVSPSQQQQDGPAYTWRGGSKHDKGGSNKNTEPGSPSDQPQVLCRHSYSINCIHQADQRLATDLEWFACLQVVSIKGLIELKAMAQAERQRALREHVACEQRLQQDASLSRLAEWSVFRRAMPHEETLPPPPVVAVVRRSVQAGCPSANELQAEAHR